MRKLALLALLGIVGCSFNNHQLSPEATAQAEQEVRHAETRLAEALNVLDDAALDNLWDDHLVFTAPNGHSSTKTQRLKVVRDARASASGRVTSTNDDVQVQILGTAAVAYVVSSWHGTDAPPQQYRATHVWSNENGAWRLVSAHVTKVSP